MFICARDYTDMLFANTSQGTQSPLVKNFKTNINQSTMWQNVGHTSPDSKLFSNFEVYKENVRDLQSNR